MWLPELGTPVGLVLSDGWVYGFRKSRSLCRRESLGFWFQ